MASLRFALSSCAFCSFFGHLVSSALRFGLDLDTWFSGFLIEYPSSLLWLHGLQHLIRYQDRASQN